MSGKTLNAEELEALTQLRIERNGKLTCLGVNRSLQEALDEAQREYNVRERCFPKWLKEGRITASDAKDRLERQAAACFFLNALLRGEVAEYDRPV